MKRKIVIMVATTLLLLLHTTLFATDGWQADIRVSVMNAENRLSIGQRYDATDGIDGRYDVPALLSGDIIAYIEIEGKEYWRDIRGKCGIQNAECGIKMWDIVVESPLEGKPIQMTWKPSDFPSDIKITLRDTITNTEIDMKKKSGYEYQNTGKRQFVIEVQQ